MALGAPPCGSHDRAPVAGQRARADGIAASGCLGDPLPARPSVTFACPAAARNRLGDQRMNLAELVSIPASMFPEQEIVRFEASGLTYEAFADRVARTAGALQGLGVT